MSWITLGFTKLRICGCIASTDGFTIFMSSVFLVALSASSVTTFCYAESTSHKAASTVCLGSTNNLIPAHFSLLETASDQNKLLE